MAHTPVSLRCCYLPTSGVQTAPFYVIRNARIPAILVEVGFVNHPSEGKTGHKRLPRPTCQRAGQGHYGLFEQRQCPALESSQAASITERPDRWPGHWPESA
ncbi:N-acetylmuramoyl-L-alanine amidase [Meiothermus sp.]|uniref:N-acetylmuramoyl-L-alanine amidase n=1 Tax=Meiothermus sp. TaxID=1955249 RepID=UPI0030156649